MYIGTGNVMTLANAYTITTTINIIGAPIRILPLFLGQVIEFMVAMRRIQAFLACEEINDSNICRIESDIERQKLLGVNIIHEDITLKIDKAANFHWGLGQKTEKSTGKGGKKDQ